VCVRGVPYLTAGVGDAGHKAGDGSSPAVVSPPPLRADGGRSDVQRTVASRPTAHMKPASSRAIAVQTTVLFLPRALSER
jgi:hypothetical protein